MSLLEVTSADDISTFAKTKWGIPEPAPAARRSFEELAQGSSEIALIVPAVGLTRSGLRVGYGGGYYDRFLTQLNQQRRELGLDHTPTIAIGLACQEINEDITLEAHDVAIDTVLLAVQ